MNIKDTKGNYFDARSSASTNRPASIPLQDLSGGDPEAQDQNVGGAPPKPNLKEIFANPLDYLSLIVFLMCGFFGGLCAIFAITRIKAMGIPLALSLLILGAWSSYEIRMLAALKKELNELQAVEQNLKQQVGRLTEEVQVYDEQNERFKEETQELKNANDEFQKQVEELDQTANELTQAKEEFQSHNKELQYEKQSLAQSVTAMQGNLTRLTHQTDELESQYQQFQQLQSQIQKYAEKNGYDMGVALERQGEMFGKLETVMRDNAATLLQQIASDMEFADDQENMTREEYDKWHERIPQRFKDMLTTKGITFDTFKGRDGVIDFEEMSKLIESLLKDSSQAV